MSRADGSAGPRVLVAAENAPTRVGLRLALEAHAVCSEVETAKEAVAAAERERPDVCLVDLDGAGFGIGTVSEIVAGAPETSVIVLTSSPEETEFLAVMRAGASGYLPRGLDPARLPSVVQSVLRGEAAVPRPYVTKLIEELRGQNGLRRRVALSPEHSVELTEREWETLELLRQGLTSREIAARLGISQVTVRRHLSTAYAKLGVTSRESALDLLAT